ncbi:double-stranded RNA-binding protein 4-like isoform X5 [Quercus robur]|uniref:double-stranded RNA-binding protein 4-like isoform X5 n=1 Tax=Quercus robur TaxID=38942 RepID=UPI0021616E26|nr:double-stranded RNA-binding protein 4-like isoform X5 [Quercus robur]
MMASSSSQPLKIEKLSSNAFPQPQLSTQPLLQPQPQPQSTSSSSSQPLKMEKLSSNVFPQPQLSAQPLLQPQPLLHPQLQPQPLLQPQPQPLLQPQPQPLLQPQPQPQPQSTSTSAAQSSSSRLSEPVMHKNRLQEYTQRLGIQMPMYKTRNEGMQHAPKFRSTVEVDGCIYTSPNTFSLRKTAEQDVAKLALEHILKKIKDEGCPHIHEDKIFCKSILNEFAVKMNLEKPTYNTVKLEREGFLPVFMSTLVFNGLYHTGELGRNKKEAEQLAARAVIISLLGNSGLGTVLSEIIKSKDKLYAALHKLKDTSHANISAVPQAVGVSIGQGSGQVSHELILSKPEPSQAVNLPIEFVPAVLPEPSDVGPSSLKKRRKNKKKPNKKLRSDTQLSIAGFPITQAPITQAPPCSVAQ